MNRIRPSAVIFDYGNVLSAPQGLKEVEAMAAMFNAPTERFRQAYWAARVAYDEAALDPISYWNGVATALSRTLTRDQIATLLEVDARSWSYPSNALVRWAREIHDAGLKTALLSNMPIAVRERVERCDWLPPFDQRVFSCDVRVAKPALEIFHYCVDALGVEPPDILFLDDRPENIQAAEALGMHGIVYTSVQHAAAEFKSRFDLPAALGRVEEER